MTPILNNQPIFIHSLWRAGSTYVFNCFRRSAAGYWAYQEPVHEIALIAKDNPDVLAEFTSETLAPLRHPKLENPYFYELQQTHSAWKDAIEKRIVYDDYFDAAPIEPLQYYLQALISASRGRPVIQECRTSGRIHAIKQAIGGVHIYLWRNPWDQWWSFKQNDYFDAACQIILGAEYAPLVIHRLREEIHYQPFHHDNVGEEFQYFKQHPLTAEHSYLVFYTLWCLGLIEGHNHANVLLNIDSLSQSDSYKHEIADQFTKLGIQGIDFSDCNVPEAFFDAVDQKFFTQIESRAQGLLLASGVPQEVVDNVRRLQQQHAPFRTDTTTILTRDLQRTREIALRAYSTDANRTQHFHHIIQQTEAEKANLNQHHQTQLQELQHQRAEQERLAAERIQMLDHALLQSQSDSATREQRHVEHIVALQAELSNELRIQAQREREFNTQLDDVRQQTEAEKANLNQHHQTQLQELQHQRAEQERLAAERIQMLDHALLQSQSDSATREQRHVEHIVALQAELSNELRIQAQREREFNTQLDDVRQQTEAEKANLNQHHQTQLQELQHQRAEQERLAAERIQMLDHALLQSQSDSATREQRHVEHIVALQAELSNELRIQAQREREFNTQLDDVRQQTEAEKANLNQHHQTQLQELQHQRAEQERLAAERIQMLDHALLQSQSDSATREQRHVEHIVALQAELSNELRIQAQREREFNTQLDNIRQQIETEKVNIRTQLHINLTQQVENAKALAQRITDIQNSWLWRLYTLFRPNRWINIAMFNDIGLIDNFSPDPLQGNNPEKRHDEKRHDTTNNTHQSIATKQCIIEVAPTAPSTIPPQSTRELSNMLPPQHIYELFIYDEHEFINIAYRTLLGREPDPSGMNYYLGRLRMGHGKASIVVQIANSSEAVHNDNIKGLANLIKEEQLARHWFWGLFTSHQRLERLMQRNADELGRVVKGMSQLNANVQRLPTVIDAHAQRMQVSLNQLSLQAADVMHEPIAMESSGAPAQPQEPEGFKELLPREQDIYLLLKRAATYKAGRTE